MSLFLPCCLIEHLSINFPIMGFFNYSLRKRHCLKLQAAMNCNQNISTFYVLHWWFLLVCLRWEPLTFINVTSFSSISRCPIHLCLFSPDVPFISTGLCCFIHDAFGCIFSLSILPFHLYIWECIQKYLCLSLISQQERLHLSFLHPRHPVAWRPSFILSFFL